MLVNKGGTLAHFDDTDPDAALTVDDLAGLLRQVRAHAGNPSLRDLDRAARRDGRSLPRSSVSEMLAAKRLPRQDLLFAFLDACGLDPAGDPRWLAAWNRLATRAADPAADQRAPLEDELIRDLRAAGLARLGTGFMTGLPWGALFARTRELDIYVAYAQTWTRMNSRDLAKLAARPATCIRVVLADPDDQATLDILAARFDTTAGELRRRIVATSADYAALRQVGGATIEIRYRAGDRLFSCFRFDDTAVLGLYSHTRSRTANIPVLVGRKPGDLFDFVTSEWAEILRDSRTA